MVTLPNIGLFDIGLCILYSVIIYFFAFRYQQFKKETYPEYRYFLLGLTTKFLGSISFVLISLYYYQKGDTFLYFQIAEDLRTHLFVDFNETVETFFTSYANIEDVDFNPLHKYNYYYERTSNWDFGRLVFLINIVSFGSFLVSSVLMALVSFLGLWLGYRVVCSMYQKIDKMIFFPFFLIPTALIWSSGILKDTIIIGVIGLMLFAFSGIFIQKKRFILNALIIILGVISLQLFRPILLFVFIPAMFLWGVLHLTTYIELNRIKVLTRIASVIGIVVIGWGINQYSTSDVSKYNTANLMKTLNGFQSFHSMEKFSEGQSVYTLGGIMSSPKEVVINIPEAINVTFFRPYVWEVNNITMLLGAIESLLLLIVFIYVLIVSRKTLFSTLTQNNGIIFMITFSIIYGAVVGLSSYNFGALSRYKMPAVLFFLLSLIVIRQEITQRK